MIDPGAVFAVGGSLLVAALTAGASIVVRRSREGTSMRDAWDRIDGLQAGMDANRRALRITEDGLDAMWRWTQRVLAAWPSGSTPPSPTASEQRDISRARHAVELSTGPIPKLQEQEA